MSKENENKIEDAKFKVGDVVRLKSAKHLVTLKSSKGASYNPSAFTSPYMVVSEIFIDEKLKLHRTNSITGESEKIKSIGDGPPIKVKCIWFYEGKSDEKVFWQDVLEEVAYPSSDT